MLSTGDEMQLKIEKSKIDRNLDILEDREMEFLLDRFGLESGGEESHPTRECRGNLDLTLPCITHGVAACFCSL